ncbi:3-ketoacyl-ACP reductase [Primorskyibacter flagellatus]|uniref:3-ketoacyl-ACP reductase n=1 Tax=Primorskyibacter flagellatus TaxID=1387277 RepID=A0A917ACZ1_9RHOB|nr:SDR family oxidoreductase [Primorskyibacter flagellatus]GGE43149.1 3-ketoacyl-ACP reductase [Primorskyibacter flagellatus]
MRLSGKTAIVTGGAQGFGAGIVRRFVEEGARVMVADIQGEAAMEVAKEVGGIGCAVDVAKADSINAMVAQATETWGQVDIMVNNAGVSHMPKPLEDVTEEEFDRVLNVNVRSIYLTAKALVPAMKARKSGCFVQISSTAGVSPRPNLNWYNASKGWVNTATRTMAVELAPHGIRVNAVNPVAGETPLLPTFMGEDTPEMRAKFLSTIPMGRLSTPLDIANASLFLASEEAAMVTGLCMLVDGGRCI